MRTTLFSGLLLAAALQLSCGGTEATPEVIETATPDFLPSAAPHQGLDLGMVVSSGIVPSENIPPPPVLDR